MTHANRSLPGTSALRSAKTRAHAITAAAALAFLAGLTGPASAAFADTPHTATASAAHNSSASGAAHTYTAHTSTAQHLSDTAAKAIIAKTGVQPAPAKPATWADIAPSAADLFSQGKTTNQSTINLNPDQLKNARTIVQTGQKLGLQPRAWVIALSTAMQESKLTNLGDLGAANDHDSLGLFQQRPASGWGSPGEITNPVYAATKFYQALEQIPGWQGMAVTDAAQAVQVSAVPDAYAQWEQQAGTIISGLYGYGPYANAAHNLK